MLKDTIKNFANKNVAILKKEQANKLLSEITQELNKVIDNLDFWTLFVPDKDEERDMIDRDDLKEKLGLKNES